MPRVTTAFKEDRRAEILEAARRCVARSGFHQASMQEICAEAGMSPGNLYRYFPSKEAIIAGIAERDRAEVGAQLAAAQYTDDFFATFAALARHHLIDRSADDVGLCTEMVAESRRNPAIAKIMQDFDADVRTRLIAMLRSAAGRGDIRSDVDFEGVVTMLMVIADGVWWRRAVDPAFDAETVLPIFMDLTRHMLLGNAADRTKNKDAQS
ncbi:MAG TPA: TetR/AcrR family transcriptional regulator [Xanthobacteraceae bacterium]|nr:TetR/AcrR family transcriptional regulator [Xanthobacteraceae bacterium]